MYLVTGGAGFIGSNIIEGLEARGLGPIIICDTLGTEDKWRNIAQRALYDFITPSDLFAALETYRDQLKAIIHMGAISSTTETDADLIVKTNFCLSVDLWEWCTEAQVPFLYASSAATYGDGSQGFVDNQSLEALKDLHPLNAYGWSKHAFDMRVMQIVEKGGPTPPQWAGFKFFNVYGPNEYHKGAQQSVVSHIYQSIKQGSPARLFRSYQTGYHDGGQLRDFLWVGDCVNVVLWFLSNPQASGIFNVGTGQARSFDDLARAVYAALNLEPHIKYIDMPETLRSKYQYFTEAEMKKLKSVGYDDPFTSLEKGVEEYVQSYLMQENPYN